MKHDWDLDEDGEIDTMRVDGGLCYGPQCKRCERAACQLCEHKIYEEECPGTKE